MTDHDPPTKLSFPTMRCPKCDFRLSEQMYEDVLCDVGCARCGEPLVNFEYVERG